MIDGKRKPYSHYIWFLNTGYWCDYKNKREIIHHINGNRRDDKFKNLELKTIKEHMTHHLAGIPLSEEHKRKMSENHADVSGKNNPMYGTTGDKCPSYGRIGDKHPMYKSRTNNR